MPQFTYKAKSGPRDSVDGSIFAENVQAAIQKIIQLGQTPIDIQVVGGTETSSPVGFKKPAFALPTVAPVRLTAVAIFTRSLSDLLEAGMPLLRALELLSKQKLSPAFKQIISQMASEIKNGSSLSSALKGHPAVFNKLYVNMVKSAEASSNLPATLARLGQNLEQDLHVRARVKSALLYPCIILIVGITTVFVLLTFVLPRLTVLFDDFGADLPLLTKMVMGLSGFLSHFWWAILMIVGVLVFYAKQWSSTDQGRRQVSSSLLRLPIISDFLRDVEISRFALTLGTLLEAGVPITSALEACVGVTDNAVYTREIEIVAQKVHTGISLSQALKAGKVFPELAVNLVMVGEETGKLEQSLYKLAQISEQNSREITENFMTVLGPIILVVIVGIVGILIAAMLLPLLKMNMIIN